MEPLITVSDITSRLDPRVLPLTEAEETRVSVLITDAEEEIRDAFSRLGRSLDVEMLQEWVANAARRVARDMVSAAVVIGPNAGARSVSSATGPQSDSVTWDKRPPVRFSGVQLTDEHREELGLPAPVRSRFSFPRSRPWPEMRWR